MTNSANYTYSLNKRGPQGAIKKYNRIPISRTHKGSENRFEKSREFEKSKVASNDTKLLRYCFITGSCGHFRTNRWEMANLSLDCVIKIQNELHYNFSGSVHLLRVANVTGISTKCIKIL